MAARCLLTCVVFACTCEAAPQPCGRCRTSLTDARAKGLLSPSGDGGGEDSADGSERDRERAPAELDALVLACIEALDISREDRVKSLLGRALADARIHAFDPSGQQFDPTRHRAVMSEPGDAGQDGIVAETLRVGYDAAADGRVVRLPNVSVFAGKDA